MRIGFLGTRGIPNRYGGFEEFAEKVSKHWAVAGHEVIVYCEDTGMREYINIDGIDQIFITPSTILGLGQFIYDFNCTKDAISKDCDIFFHAGYATSVIGNLLLRRKLRSKLVYNMDGLEWKRSKFSWLTRQFTKFLERLAVNSGAVLVSDNKGIKDYIFSEYGLNSVLIEYGASFQKAQFNSSSVKIPSKYDLVIARFEPENHIEEIIRAYLNVSLIPLVVIANNNTRFYFKIESLFKDNKNIIFLGPVYDKSLLSFYRENCRLYVHGHSVGGTNPSLLEALDSGCLILAHQNQFNIDVVQEHGYFWSDQKQLELLISRNLIRKSTVEAQIKYTESRFNWEKIANKYLNLFEKMLDR
jgi:glycosyltransferase involved in cell wall biosynthesis